jgi:hypothetical protein
MGALDQAEASRLLRNSLAIAAGTISATPMMLRLMSANGSASSNGTQVTGGSYAAQNLTTALGTEANGQVNNSSSVSFTGMPAITTTGVEVWDSAGTPLRKWWGALSASKTTGVGDTLTFAATTGVAFNINA